MLLLSSEIAFDIVKNRSRWHRTKCLFQELETIKNLYNFNVYFYIEIMLRMKKETEFEDSWEYDSILKIFMLSSSRTKRYLRKIPEIRWDKVTDYRQKIFSKDWHPKTERIAEKVLYEHLYIPTP